MDPRVRRRCSGSSTQVDTVKGKAGDALREHLADVLRNRRLTELVTDVELPTRPSTTWSGSSGTARQVHQLFDDLQFRVLRERLFQYRRGRGAGGGGGLRRRLGDVLTAGDGHASGSTSTHATGIASASRSAGSGAAAPGR